MSSLLNGENEWEVVQLFNNLDNAQMPDALINGANALSLNLKDELAPEKIIESFKGIQLDLIHLYLNGSAKNLESILKHNVNATIPLKFKALSSAANISFYAYEFANKDFIQESTNCLSIWKSYLEEDNHQMLCVGFIMNDDYIDNICKIRAIRNLWNMMLQSFNLTEIPIKILALQKNYNPSKTFEENIIKASLNLTAAALASADAILISEAENEEKTQAFRARISRNLHHLATEESKLNLVHDPLKGSYVIEENTRNLTKEAWNKFLK